MPDGDNPDGGTLNAVEEAVRAEHNLSMRQLGELGEAATEMREPFKRPKTLLGAQAEAFCRGGVVCCDVPDGR